MNCAQKQMKVIDYITKNIGKSIKKYDGNKFNETLIELPYPYSTPCASKTFQEMYYWDTYFTNKGLIFLGKKDQVANNINNFIFLIEKYGFIPNGNRTYFLNRSQPPFFGLMLKDALEFNIYGIDIEKAFNALKSEYNFWENRRKTENGLNKYGSNTVDSEYLEASKAYIERTKRNDFNISVENGKNVLAEFESGWDLSPRYLGKCNEFNPLDLNCLLYVDELILFDYYKDEIYLDKANKRKKIMDALMKDDNGVYNDYNFIERKRSSLISAASFFPFFVGLSKDIRSYKKLLESLELKYGIVAALNKDKIYQWGYPNCWAPLNYIAFQSALNLGLVEDAKRIAMKYNKTIDNIFSSTYKLWEKFNAEDGSMDVVTEYETPAFLGWTAGVYAVFNEFINSNGCLR